MAQPAPKPEPWAEQLSSIADPGGRRAFLESHPELISPAAVDHLYDSVIAFAWVDVQKAERLAEASEWISSQLQDQSAIARSARAVGHIFYLTGKYRQAIREYERAMAIYESLGSELELARTINGALQSLSYDGQYERAFQLADRARSVFSARNDHLRLARLESNLANLYYRQDRFRDAVELYERAQAGLLKFGEPQDVAILLRNLAVCYISLNEFPKALETHEQARNFCEQHGLPLLQAKADYNIAYLYYLRGEYLKAIELYDATRNLCGRLGDEHHQALCDLDESEIYLELNLTEGGAQLARKAFRSFTELGMNYEAAKAAAFFAIAVSQQGRRRDALALFDRARDLFVREKNELWPALIDLYKAVVVYDTGNDVQAGVLARRALEYFAHSPLPAKAALCELLLAEIELRENRPAAARALCLSALDRLRDIDSPAIYQAHFVLGQAEEAGGNVEAAQKQYQTAYWKLEDLRSQLGREELKIAFLKNKLAVYEGLVVTSVAGRDRSPAHEAAFRYMEQAKSRSLADLIAFRATSLQSRSAHSEAAGQFRDLRQKLNWTYHQIELEELNPGENSSAKLQRLRQQGREFESGLVKAFSNLRAADQELAGLHAGYVVSPAEIQAALPPDAMLLEYYEARGRFYAALVRRDSIRVVELGESRPVRERLRLLQLQLAKFRLGDGYVGPLRRSLLQATQSHLQELHSALVAPLAGLDCSHLVIVPHGFLHYLPFHALHDGSRYLIDRFSISYAPSSSIFSLCHSKQPSANTKSLVLAIPDARAPQISLEARNVAAALQTEQIWIGEEASEARLRALGPESRVIHIATHGYFRQDNPMFSAIRLGTSMLSLFDLYQLQLDADLVTLSGCGTGMNVVIGGDELIGLIRGLLYAGARSVLVSLWEVHDESTSTFMQKFYDFLKSGDKAKALQSASIAVREQFPHPYHWAAFSMVGRFL